MSNFDEPIVPCPYCGTPLSESECERLRRAAPPVWVAALAAEWEAESRRQCAIVDQQQHHADDREERLAMAVAYDECAEQLRERASKEQP